MATDLITVYIKNLAGDLFPLDVEPSLSLHEIAQQLSLSYPEVYPMGRIQLLRLPQTQEDEEGDEKEFQPPLSPEEVLAVVIMDPARMEQGSFPQCGQSYTRFVVPFRGRTLYLYLMSYITGEWENSNGTWEHTIEFAVSWSPEVTKPSETLCAQHQLLYQTMKTFVPDVTPKEMRSLYDIVLPYCDQLGSEDGCTYIHILHPKEPIECECGSVVQRSGLSSHIKTKKHKMFVQHL